jgi:hypothetical protein
MEYVLQAANSRTSLSFPHASSGSPGGIRIGPPIKTFGDDDLGSRFSSPQPQFSMEYHHHSYGFQSYIATGSFIDGSFDQVI